MPTSTHSDTDREGGGEMSEGGEVGGGGRKRRWRQKKVRAVGVEKDREKSD